MDYKKVTLENFDFDVMVRVIAPTNISKFLSELVLPVSGFIRREEYEGFLFQKLIKNQAKLDEAFGSQTSDNEKGYLRLEVLSAIYKINPKLSPSTIVVVGNNLMYVSDAMREKNITHPTLPTNPGWTSNDDGSDKKESVNEDLVKGLIEEVWDNLKERYPERNYFLCEVDVIGIELPVLEIASIEKTIDIVVEDFITQRCNGNVLVAKENFKSWFGHVLALTIPRVDEIIYTLSKANYIGVYSQTIITREIYAVVLQINPELAWEKIDWSKYLNGDKKDKKTRFKSEPVRVRSRTPSKTVYPPTRGSNRRSTREEVNENTLHFSDIQFSDILTIGQKLKEKIVGQDEAVDSLCNAIRVARVGLRGDKRPIGSFLFAGTTGVGKTELCKILAQELTKTEPIRIDCSEYQSAHEISKLFGSPPGYIGFEDSGRSMGENYTPPVTLASKIRKTPFSVVLFDELEKADEAIYHVLLQIMDEGRITSGRGDTLHFNEAIILMTSNVGTSEAADMCAKNKMGFGDDDRNLREIESKEIQKAIEDKFKPEFRNRLSGTLLFNKLRQTDCENIAEIVLGKTKENLEKSQHVTMKWCKDLPKFIVEKGYSEEFGARNIERTVRDLVELPVAEYILENYINHNDIPEKSVLSLNIKDDKVIVTQTGAKKSGKKTGSKS